jgi:hypothetical protein
MKKREAARVRPFLLAELRPNITNIPTRAYLGEIREKNIIAADQPQNTSSYLSRKAKSAVDRPSHASNSSLQPFVERDISAILPIAKAVDATCWADRLGAPTFAAARARLIRSVTPS